MKSNWMNRLGRKEALLLGASAVAILSVKPAKAATVNIAEDADTAVDSVTNDYVLAHTNATLTLNAGAQVTGTVDHGTSSGGMVIFSGSGTITGNVGSGGDTGGSSLGTITAGVASSNAQFDGTVNATTILITNTGSVTFSDGSTLSGAIVGSAVNGEVVFTGDGTVAGTVGLEGSAITTITAGATGKDVQFGANIFVDALLITNDGSVTFADNVSMTGAIVGSATNGEVVFTGDGTVSGTVGAVGSAITTVTAGAAATGVEFGANSYVDVLLITNTGSVTFADGASLAGSIVGSAANGELIFTGSSTVTGTIGATGSAITTVTAGATGKNVQFDSSSYITTLFITNDGSVTFADAASLAGAIVGSAVNGELVFAGDSTVTGTVGLEGSAITTITAGATGKNVEFGANMHVDVLLISNNGSVTFADDVSMSGAIVGSATNGEVVFAGDGTVSGAVGAAGSAISTVTAGASGSSVQFDGAVQADVLLLTHAGAVTFADNATLSGAIVGTSSASASSSELLFVGSSTIAGAIGTAGSTITTIRAGVAGDQVQFDSDVSADLIMVTAEGTVSLANGASISGAIVASSASTSAGELQFAGNNTLGGNIGIAASGIDTISAGAASTTVQFDGTEIYAAAINLSTGTVTFSNSATVGGAIAVSDGGTLDIGSKTITGATGGGAAGTVTFAGTGTTVQLKIIDSSTFGSISSATDFNAANAKVTVDLGSATGYIANDQTFKIFDSSGGTLSNGEVVVTTLNSAVLSFTSGSAGNAVTLTAVRATGGYAAAAAGTSTTAVSGISTTLEALGASATGSMATMLSKLDAMNATDLGQALTQLAPPSMNGATTAAASQVTTAVSNVVNARIAMLQGHQVASADGVGFEPASGVSAGSGAKRHGAWVQVLGSYGDQGTRKNVDGYDSTTYGMALGVDTAVKDKARVGLAFSYANTTIDDKGARDGNSTDVNSYMLNLYGTYDITNAWYVDGGLTFGLHQYDTTRKSTLLSATASGDFNGYQYGVNTRVGYKVPLNKGKMLLTPFASLDYTRLDQDGYTETGTGGLPLKVDSQSFDSLKIGGGARLSGEIKRETVRLLPEVHGGVFYDTLAGKTHTTATFTGGGSAFRVDNVEPARTSFNAGLGLSVVTASDLTVTVTYDADLKEDFAGHTGAMKVRMPF
ncbi:autotransporter domain-containing protein [Magnetospirillum sp. SS-4]|uniref:autotransporter domain-containing protein n=1 Tax=Magnetospirillum sp. SS-4 TaxID=2681465 RepID=UPI0013809AE5|nr:autotransporter domain-containing protein [Magnetospirillum sp. SS-4]CAA7623921.1 exported hypothetical protein [Magnetospirillum sp. SS-4]